MIRYMCGVVAEFYLGKSGRFFPTDEVLRRDWAYCVSHADMWDVETDNYLNRFGL